MAATASEAAFMSEGVIVGSNIGRLLFLAAWSLIGQQPGQYNSVGRSDRKRCFAAKSTLRLIGLLRGGLRVDAERLSKHRRSVKLAPPITMSSMGCRIGYLKVAPSSSSL